MRTMNVLAAALLALSLALSAPPALAQGTDPIDREYETASPPKSPR